VGEDPPETISFASAAELRDWFAEHHGTASDLWLLTPPGRSPDGSARR
jgi:hypothetical protein